jgi:hypothetical protein
MKVKIVTLFKVIPTSDGWEVGSCDFKETPKYYKPMRRKPGFTMTQVRKNQLEWEGLALTPEGAINIRLKKNEQHKESLRKKIDFAAHKEGQLLKLLAEAEREKISGGSGIFLTVNFLEEGQLEHVLAQYEKRYGGVPDIAHVNDKGKKGAQSALQACGLAEIELSTARSGGIFMNEIWFEAPGEK